MRVAFIGYGEVAAAFSTALLGRGVEVAAYDVLLDQPGGMEKLRARAGDMKIAFCPLADAVGKATYILSTVTTSVAQEAARRCVPHLRTGRTFVDFNATDPALKTDIERIITPTGAAFVEGAVLGAVGVTGAKTEILLGGPHARRAERDLAGEMGLNVRFYSEQLGFTVTREFNGNKFTAKSPSPPKF